MIPAAFEYKRASSVDEAIRLLGEHGDDAKLLAGGHSLIPMMKLRLAAPAVLIDIAGHSAARHDRRGRRTHHDRRADQARVARRERCPQAQRARAVGRRQRLG